MVVLRRSAGVVFVLLIAYGLWARDGITDGRWLSLLGIGWLLLLVACWPSLPAAVPTFNRTTIRTAVLLTTVFVVLTVQLVRIQIVQSEATVGRIVTDPVTRDVIANPRIQIADLKGRRGRVFDRNGVPLAGTRFEGNTMRRFYPEPESAYVLGYFSPLLYGKAGLEATYDEELSGSDGNNAILRGIDDLLDRPRQGLDLQLTLDAALQRTAHQLLAGRPGAAVLLDAETGAVLTLASNPNFNPNRLFTSDSTQRDEAAGYWEELVADPLSPLLPRATSGLFTPGSTFKVVSAAAAIDAGFSGPETVYEDDGTLDVEGHVIVEQNRPDDSRSTWTLREGLAWSLNVVFAQVGLQLGPDLMRDYGERFGFGEPVPFDLQVAESQLASDPEFLDSLPGLADTGFGQGEVLATPLQMALVAASVANGGEMMRPYLVERMSTQKGGTVRHTRPRGWRRPVDEATADQVAELMVGAVEQGVAQGAFVPGYRIGGKTGTAETGDGEPHAWFIGFIGERGSRYAVAVVLEHGGSGMAGALAIGRDLLIAATASETDGG